MKGYAAGVRGAHEHEQEAAVATLWRALARGWPRRRTSASSVESPCGAGTIDKVSKALLGKSSQENKINYPVKGLGRLVDRK